MIGMQREAVWSAKRGQLPIDFRRVSRVLGRRSTGIDMLNNTLFFGCWLANPSTKVTGRNGNGKGVERFYLLTNALLTSSPTPMFAFPPKALATKTPTSVEGTTHASVNTVLTQPHIDTSPNPGFGSSPNFPPSSPINGVVSLSFVALVTVALVFAFAFFFIAADVGVWRGRESRWVLNAVIGKRMRVEGWLCNELYY